MRRPRVLLPALLLGALATCDSGPRVGEVVFALATPNQDDGALQFTVRASDPATVVAVAAACADCEVYADPVSDAELRGVVTGTIVPGPVLRVTVSDRRVDGYTASVAAVASRTYQIRNAAGYTLTLER